MSLASGWEPGDRAEVSWYDRGSWHENLRNLDGLKLQPRKYMDTSAALDCVKQIYEIVLPHDEAMYRQRITASNS